ncbi:type IV pilus biogenesis protein PilM [Selenomonas montiformis]|uniref:type IV pilus biogenesis protein PilM n=1 Tax=Selenomonas montiformis TaxID=2652285 RepID=UPI003F8C72E3
MDLIFKERWNGAFPAPKSIMIGISISPEAIRGVRLEKKKNKYIVAKTSEVALFPGDIVQGRIKNKESVLETLQDLKADLKITTKDDVFVGLPNESAKINSFTADNDVNSISEAVEMVPLLGNKKNYTIDIPYVSGNFYLENEEGYKRLVKTITYCAVNTEVLNEYVDVFKQADMPVALMEPIALAEVEYLRYDATEPFAIVDINSDGVTFIVFAQKYGINVYKMTDVNSHILINDVYNDDGELVSSNVNNTALNKIVARIDSISSQYKIKNNMQEDSGIRQVIITNADYEFVANEFADKRPDIESYVSSDMMPRGIAETFTKGVDTEYLDLFYSAMVIAMASPTSNMNKKDSVALNYAPKEFIDSRRYYKARSVILTGLIGATALSSIYMAGTIGLNVKAIYSKPDSSKLTPELEKKYDEAKKEDQKMHDNIAKYNTIAENKSKFAKTMDAIVLAKPGNVMLTTVNVSSKKGAKRAIVECVSDSNTAHNDFIEAIRLNPDMAGAEVLNQQTKMGKTAVQISVPLE